MQHKPADTSRADRIANQNSRDAAINERLVAVIKANAQVVASDARPADRLESLGFLRQSLAFVGLGGLLIAICAYTALVGDKA